MEGSANIQELFYKACPETPKAIKGPSGGINSGDEKVPGRLVEDTASGQWEQSKWFWPVPKHLLSVYWSHGRVVSRPTFKFNFAGAQKWPCSRNGA